MLTIAFVLAAGLTAPAAETQTRLEQVLPEDTLALISLTDLQASAGRFQETAMGRIWGEPEVQEFFAPIIEKIRTQLGQARAGGAQGGPQALAAGLLDVVPGQIAIAALPPQPGQQPPVPGVVVLVEAHEGIEQIQAILSLGVGVLQTKAGLAPGAPFTHQGVEVNVLANPMVSVCHAIDGQRLIVTTAPAAMKQVLDGLRTPSAASLAKGPVLATLSKKLGATREGVLLINVEGLLKHYEPLLMAMAPPQALQVIDALGVKEIRSLAIGMAFDGLGVREVVCIRAPEERRGITALLDMPVGPKELLKKVPADAIFCSATKLDFATQYSTLMGLIRDVQPDAYDEVMTQLGAVEQQLGFSIKDDVVDALGDEAVLYYRFPTELAILAKTAKSDALRKVLDIGLTAAAAASPPRWRREQDGVEALSVEVLSFMDHEIHYAPIQADATVLWPAYTIVNDVCVVALAPQTVKSVIARLESTGGGSIVHVAKYKEATGKVSPEHVSIEFVDATAALEAVYSVGSIAFQWGSDTRNMRKMRQDTGVDWGKLPSKEAIARHLFPWISCYTVDADGFWIESYAPTFGGSSFASAGLMSGMLLPAITRARSRAQQAASTSNMKQIGLAMHMYANDHDEHLPPRDQFVKSLEPYVGDNKRVFYHPRNKQPALGQFPGNIDYTFSKTLPTKLADIQNPSKTPVAWEKRSYDRRGARCVLFADGHVESLSRGRFRMIMRQRRQVKPVQPAPPQE